MKGLINLKNKDQKCFTWCHPQNRNAGIINKQDKKIAANLSYSEIAFLVMKIKFILYTFQKLL